MYLRGIGYEGEKCIQLVQEYGSIIGFFEHGCGFYKTWLFSHQLCK